MHIDTKRLGLRLKICRELAKKSQREVAEHLGLRQSQVCRYEEDTSNMTAVEAHLFCRYVGASLDLVMSKDPIRVRNETLKNIAYKYLRTGEVKIEV